MSYFAISFLWYIISLITIKATIITSNPKSPRPHHPKHYKSQHFQYNNAQLWSSTTTPSQEIISCTLNIPSLCLYYIPNTPGFHIFYGNKMFDFLHDTNWSKVIVTNNLDNEQYNNIISQLIQSNISYELPMDTAIEMPIETPMDDIMYNNSTRRRLSSSSYTWRGCYKDTGRRALRHGPHNWHYSINRCYRACKKYRYFSLQAGSWCSCENSWSHATKYGRGRGCRRDHKGGGWRNDIFAIRRSRRRTSSRRGRSRRRKRKTRWHRCGMKCKLKKAINKLRRRYKRESRDAKMRGRVYNRLYRFGKLLGSSMRTGNFGGLCGLTGECDMGPNRGRRGRGMGMGMGMRGRGGRGCGSRRMSRCPTRFRTYLGPPHIVGKVSYILGSPPVGTAPSGWAGGQGFGQGLGVSPMYPGMMGGMNGMQAPGMWPGMMGGMSGHPQAMVGDMGYGKKEKEKEKEKSKEKKVKKVKKKKRRLMMDMDMELYNNIWDVRMKKCVYVNGNEEICAVYYYMDGHVDVEYNYNVDMGVVNKGNGKNNVEYYEGNVWIWNGKESVECNSDLLDYIGYILCIQIDEKGIKALLIDDYDVDDNVVKIIDLMDDKEKWDEIYEINGMEKYKKICEYVNMIELCFEMMKYNDRRIEITTQRVLSKDVNVIEDNIAKNK